MLCPCSIFSQSTVVRETLTRLVQSTMRVHAMAFALVESQHQIINYSHSKPDVSQLVPTSQEKELANQKVGSQTTREGFNALSLVIFPADRAQIPQLTASYPTKQSNSGGCGQSGMKKSLGTMIWSKRLGIFPSFGSIMLSWCPHPDNFLSSRAALHVLLILSGRPLLLPLCIQQYDLQKIKVLTSPCHNTRGPAQQIQIHSIVTQVYCRSASHQGQIVLWWKSPRLLTRENCVPCMSCNLFQNSLYTTIKKSKIVNM